MIDPACFAPRIPKPLWIFAYGSLMWQPDFAVAESRLASVHGWRRSFCMWSIHHRGSVKEPGLVLALDREEGGLCHGVALRVPFGEEEATLALLRERELVSSAYFEVNLELELAEGERVEALGYVINRDHVQYARDLGPEAQAAIIAKAKGGRGKNRDYLYATVAQLQSLGIEDSDLSRLEQSVRSLVE